MKEGVESCVKFKKLKRRMRLPEWQVIGLLESIWKLCRTSAQAGDIGRHSNEDIAASIEYEEDADELVENLVECGWLDSDPEFRLIVHDWSDHVPNYLKGNFAKHGKTFADQVAKQRKEQPAKQDARQGATKTDQVQPVLTQTNKDDDDQPASDSAPPASSKGSSSSDIDLLEAQMKNRGVAKGRQAVELAVAAGCTMEAITARIIEFDKAEPGVLYNKVAELTPNTNTVFKSRQQSAAERQNALSKQIRDRIRHEIESSWCSGPTRRTDNWTATDLEAEVEKRLMARKNKGA